MVAIRDTPFSPRPSRGNTGKVTALVSATLGPATGLCCVAPKRKRLPARIARAKEHPRIFLLSPAHVGGLRARLLLNPHAPFDLAHEFHRRGLPLASVFTFTSGLYFRGKIAYASHFARANRGDFIRVITSNAGLVDPGLVVGPGEVAAFGATDIDSGDPRYHRPLRRDAKAIATQTGPHGTVVLLGSIATPKYREVLLEVFGDRLLFPRDFVGRGDMSRGALLLRAAANNRELPYEKVRHAVLTGRRAARISECAT